MSGFAEKIAEAVLDGHEWLELSGLGGQTRTVNKAKLVSIIDKVLTSMVSDVDAMVLVAGIASLSAENKRLRVLAREVVKRLHETAGEFASESRRLRVIGCVCENTQECTCGWQALLLKVQEWEHEPGDDSHQTGLPKT